MEKPETAGATDGAGAKKICWGCNLRCWGCSPSSPGAGYGPGTRDTNKDQQEMDEVQGCRGGSQSPSSELEWFVSVIFSYC